MSDVRNKPCMSHYPDFDHHCASKGQGCEYYEPENCGRANKIKRILGLQGNDTDKEYYRVADVICDLKHFCNKNNIDFDNELELSDQFYATETGEA